MTALKEALIKRIKSEGPMPIGEYMSHALYDPGYGYYMTSCPISKDFITAPEVSQLFGEILALWLLDQWARLGSPPAISLVELGPGRGTLCADILRTWQKLLGKKVAVTAYLVEISPILRDVQVQTLSNSPHPVKWIKGLEDLPPYPIFLVANEFFDALPVFQFIKKGGEWLERVVAVKNNALVFEEISPVTTLPFAEEEASFFEYSPASLEWAESIATSLAQQRGAALIIDYGYIGKASQDTLQAVRNHCYHPLLEQPGEVDLTYHVNFSSLSKTIKSLNLPRIPSVGLYTQADFLQQNGILLRAERLRQTATTQQQEDLSAALNRLLSLKEMGTLFKVLSLSCEKIEKAEANEQATF